MSMRAIDSPCYGCPIRYEGCHSVCTLFLRYKEDKVTLSRAKQSKAEIECYFRKAMLRSIGLRGERA